MAKLTQCDICKELVETDLDLTGFVQVERRGIGRQDLNFDLCYDCLEKVEKVLMPGKAK